MRMAILLVALLVGACAHKPELAPKPQAHHSYTAPAKIVQPAAPEATTPNQIVKKRWFDRFMKHKSK